MAFLENLGRRKPAQSLATILSIGKATPAAHCEKSMISKRHFVLTEEIINKNPNISTYSSPSIDIRQQILAAEVPKLAMEAASKAIQEWRQPKSQITHLIFSAVSGMEMPGADYRLAKLLGLPSVKRVMMYFQGCFAGGTILRIAKDIAENNAGARVLVLSSDITLPTFRAPNEHGIPSLISNAIMGDGAAAMIIGADPNVLKERPLFQIVASTESIIPDSEGAIKGHMHEAGLSIHLSRDVPKLIANNIDKCLAEALSPISINDWNSFFWIVHPLGNAVLDQIEIKLGLKKEKLIETRHVLREFGNVSSATVFFILDEMRRRSMEVGKATTGEGLQWGVLFGLGASITVETVVLRSFPTNTQLIQGKE